ncbi:SUKH-4 family immunity protein [Dactylosporangium sp. NPDC049742]|uniref:SUKH-4 family immunity protein n=1 Tax=Dactylosporangium sp. NPDC049742 TaxID=3154737 RepID=UPI0034475845
MSARMHGVVVFAAGVVMGSSDATLGVVLDTTATPAEVIVDGERLSVIGYVWDPTTELVGLDSGGAVWSYSPLRRSRVPMNSSVDALRRFLDLFGEFFAANDDPPPATYTAEQMAEKLAAFRRGEIKPAVGRPDNRAARVKRLKKTLREIDGRAVEAGWWSLVLEQVDDGVL